MTIKIVSFLASELKTLEDSSAYEAFASKLDVLWKHKNKEVQEEFNAQIQARIDEEVAKKLSNASTEEVEEVEVEEALDSAEICRRRDFLIQTKSTASKEPSLRDKFKAAFSRENIEIS